jgi:hypothetical protein
MKSWGSQTSLVRYIFTRRLHAVLGQPYFTCQVHIYTETACSRGAARLHLSGTYLHGDCMQYWGSQTSLVRYIFPRETACSPGAANFTCQEHIYTETACSPGAAILHLSGTYLHGDCMESWGSQTSLVRYIFTRRLHGVMGQPHFTCQVHIYTGDCMQFWGSQISLVRYIFTRETACSPGAARSHLSGTYLNGRLHAVLGQPHFTCQVHIYTGDCM